MLAHEISHIRHNDLRVMAVADMMSRMTGLLSLFGQLFVLLNLPLILFTDLQLPWLALLVLLFAPSVSALLQLALSRTREFDADLEAARLTGDPAGLAGALVKLERQSLGPIEWLFRQGRNPAPSVLRTHPYTQERLARLLSLENTPRPPRPHAPVRLPEHLPAVTRRPRRHITGFWH